MRAMFDCDATPLCGCKLLEASAGTGKTYCLERVVARLVVGDGGEALRIGEILVVTFTKAATAELTVRIHAALTTLAGACEAMAQGKKPTNEADALLLERWQREGLTGAKGEVFATASKRLRAALNEFDDASISTIHGFCQKALERYAFTRGAEGGLTLASDVELKALREQVRDECLERLPMDASTASKALRDAIFQIKDWTGLFVALEREGKEDRQRLQKLFPEGFCGNEAAFQWMKENFALWAIERLKMLKEQNRLTTFDDMLLDLREALHGPQGASLVAAVRKAFKAVLIDEFQDTDPIQYDIFRLCFLTEGMPSLQTLLFVGDPKQAIYSFRSAEIETYLEARRKIGGTKEENIFSLRRNFRSTPLLVDAVNAFFSRKATPTEVFTRDPFLLGQIEETDAMAVDSLYCEDRFPLLFIERETGRVSPAAAFECWSLKNASLEENHVDDIELMVRDIVRLLSGRFQNASGKSLEGLYGTMTRQGTFKPLEPSDIAILVKSRTHAEEILRALQSHGVAAGVKSDVSVFASEAAKDIVHVLEALEAPEDKKALSLAMATRFVGADCDALREDRERGFVQLTLQRAQEDVHLLGIYAALTRLMRTFAQEFDGKLFNTETRLLGQATGERYLADLLELLENLQQAQTRLPNVAALRHWLVRQSALAEAGLEKSASRAETDRSLVRIVTIHSSKGLQYPVVYLYGAGSMALGSNPNEKRYIFRESDGVKRQLKIECPPCDRVSHRITKPDPSDSEKTVEIFPTLLREEQENIRLLYVAMTRAANRLVIPLKWSSKISFKAAIFESLFGCGQFGFYDAKEKRYKAQLRLMPSEEAAEVALDAWEHRLKALRETAFVGASQTPQEAQREALKAHLSILGNAKEVLTALKAQTLTLACEGSEYVFEEIPQTLLEDPGTLQESVQPQMQVAQGHSFPRSWTQTSFTAMNTMLLERSRACRSEFFGFPAGPDAGTFLHETIEKAIVEAGRRFKATSKASSEFEVWLEHFVDEEFDSSVVKRVLLQCADGVAYDTAVLESLGLPRASLKATDYARLWLSRVMRKAFVSPLVDGEPETLESLVRKGNVATEVDFLETTLGGAHRSWSVERLAAELNGLGIKSLRFTALPDEVCRKSGVIPASHSLSGYLTGQIDILMMTGDRTAGTEKYWVLDWKSNRIEVPGHSRDHADNYRHEAMENVMDDCNYKLQALLYLTALRRYLTSRYGNEALADRHIGGAVYVFLRGLLGESGSYARQTGFFDLPYAIYCDAVKHIDAVFRGELP